MSRRVPTVNKRKLKTEEVTSGGGGVDNGGYEYNFVGNLVSGCTPTTTVITNLAAVQNVEVDEP